MIAAFRGDAERKLENFAARSIEEAKPDILQSGIVPATNAAKTAIIQALHARTSMWSNIAANLVAWVITLAVTILVITTVYLPNWQADLIARIQAIQLQQAPPPAPPPR